jgi:ABC-type antimicrobial peptide transport system permease subunit
MVLAGTTWTIGIGLLAGVGLCLLLDKLASYWLAESAKDPMILGGVIALLLAVSVIACVAPARRAASIDPMEAVRHE